MQLQVFRTGAKGNALGNRMDSVVQIFFKKKKNVVETILFLCVDKKDLLIKCSIRLHDMGGIYEVKFA